MKLTNQIYFLSLLLLIDSNTCIFSHLISEVHFRYNKKWISQQWTKWLADVEPFNNLKSWEVVWVSLRAQICPFFGEQGGNSQDREKYGLVCERLSRIQVPRNPNSGYPRVKALRVCVCWQGWGGSCWHLPNSVLM